MLPALPDHPLQQLLTRGHIIEESDDHARRDDSLVRIAALQGLAPAGARNQMPDIFELTSDLLDGENLFRDRIAKHPRRVAQSPENQPGVALVRAHERMFDLSVHR